MAVGESKTQSVCRVKILVWMVDAYHPVMHYLISISLDQTLANDVTLNADRAAMPRPKAMRVKNAFMSVTDRIAFHRVRQPDTRTSTGRVWRVTISAVIMVAPVRVTELVLMLATRVPSLFLTMMTQLCSAALPLTASVTEATTNGD